jgi:hypothetical protein
MRGRRRHRPLGPDRQRPFRMTDARPMEGEVDHELTRRRPVKRSSRAVDDDRTEDCDFNAVVRHAGERSPARRIRALEVGPGLATVTLRGGGGIRTLTGDGLSALPLPVGLRPRSTHS